MATTFLWKGRTPTGEVLSGDLQCENKQELINHLRKRKIIITSIRHKPKDIQLNFGMKNRITVKDMGIFTRQFATMINAGLPMVQCLDILATQMENKELAKIVQQVKDGVQGGATLSEALARHPKIFDPLYTNMVEAGEVGGALDAILNRLALYREKADQLIRKVKGAMVYPSVIVIVAAAVTVGMLTFIVPVFAKMFGGVGAELPKPTQVVMGISNFLQDNFVILFFGTLGSVIA